MNTKHTPGPWHIVDAVNGDWPNGCELCIDNVEGGNPETDYCIASAVHGDPNELLANARLIAAAPELLEALQDQLTFLNVLAGTIPLAEKDTHRRISIQQEELRAAIAKATGQ